MPNVSIVVPNPSVAMAEAEFTQQVQEAANEIMQMKWESASRQAEKGKEIRKVHDRDGSISRDSIKRIDAEAIIFIQNIKKK